MFLVFQFCITFWKALTNVFTFAITFVVKNNVQTTSVKHERLLTNLNSAFKEIQNWRAKYSEKYTTCHFWCQILNELPEVSNIYSNSYSFLWTWSLKYFANLCVWFVCVKKSTWPDILIGHISQSILRVKPKILNKDLVLKKLRLIWEGHRGTSVWAHM